MSHHQYVILQAVEAIRQAGNPLKLIVQSLNLWAVDGFNSSLEAMDSGRNSLSNISQHDCILRRCIVFMDPKQTFFTTSGSGFGSKNINYEIVH